MLIAYFELFSKFKPELEDKGPEEIFDEEVYLNSQLAYNSFKRLDDLELSLYYPQTLEHSFSNNRFFSPFFEYTIFIAVVKDIMNFREHNIIFSKKTELLFYDILYRTKHYYDRRLYHNKPEYDLTMLLENYNIERELYEMLLREFHNKEYSYKEFLRKTKELFLEVLILNSSSPYILEGRINYGPSIYKEELWLEVKRDLKILANRIV